MNAAFKQKVSSTNVKASNEALFTTQEEPEYWDGIGGYFSYKFSGNGKCFLSDENLVMPSDLTDTSYASYPTDSPFIEEVYHDKVQADMGDFEEVIASTQCVDYKVSLDLTNIPCLSADIIGSLDYIVGENDYCNTKMGTFFRKYGTHVVVSAKFGSELFLQGVYDKSVLTDLGLSGNVAFDATNGWCNYESAGTKCNVVSGGNLVSSGASVVTHVRTYDHQWYADNNTMNGANPVEDLSTWSTTSQANLTRDGYIPDPIAVDDIVLVDIVNFITAALTQ